MFSGVYVALRRKELGMSPVQHTTGVKVKTDTYFGSSNVGFLLGSSRPSPAGLSSASVFGITSRVISTLPWKEIVAKACLSLYFETICTHGFVYQWFRVHCKEWRHYWGEGWKTNHLQWHQTACLCYSVKLWLNSIIMCSANLIFTWFSPEQSSWKTSLPLVPDFFCFCFLFFVPGVTGESATHICDSTKPLTLAHHKVTCLQQIIPAKLPHFPPPSLSLALFPAFKKGIKTTLNYRLCQRPSVHWTDCPKSIASLLFEQVHYWWRVVSW